MHKEVQKVFHRKYFVHAQTVCTRHLLGGGGRGLGMKLINIMLLIIMV